MRQNVTSKNFSALRLCIGLVVAAAIGLPTAAYSQTAVVSAPASIVATPGAGTASYSASVSTTNPSLNSEQKADSVTYSWSTGGTGSSTTVTLTKSSPGDYNSSVSCSVTWHCEDDSTNPPTYFTATAGGSASTPVHMGVMWTPGGITGGVLGQPQNQGSTPYSPPYVFAAAGGTLSCSVSGARAYDLWTFGSNSGKDYGDSVNYAWSCSGGGFSGANPATGQSATWNSPSRPSKSSVSCKISATAGALGPYDGGKRGPRPISAVCEIYMPTLTVTGGSWSPNPAYVGEAVTGTATASLSGAPSGLSASYSWATSALYYSADGSTFTAGGGSSSGVVWTEGASTSAFTVFFDDGGFYIIGANATVALRDSSGNGLWSGSATGYVGGSPN